MALSASPNPIVIFGGGCDGGVYMLRIHVKTALELRFGGFRRGKLIPVPAGEYLYVGSALGAKGAASLPFRLVRHATRSGGRPPHRIREHLICVLDDAGMLSAQFSPPATKRLHWNVDYLLDRLEAEIVGVIAVRTSRRLESALTRLVEDEPRTRPLARGLGANDATGETHLLRVIAGESWWKRLPARVCNAAQR